MVENCVLRVSIAVPWKLSGNRVVHVSRPLETVRNVLDRRPSVSPNGACNYLFAWGSQSKTTVIGIAALVFFNRSREDFVFFVRKCGALAPAAPTDTSRALPARWAFGAFFCQGRLFFEFI